MKKIGILGGLAWPATVEYYQAICLMSQGHHAGTEFSGPAPMPEMVIESVNINHSFNRRGVFGDEDSWQDYDAYFNSALKRLEQAGADFAIIASNTPHTRFEGVTAGLKIPILSIFQAVAQACKAQSIDRFLLLGTDPTMNSGDFQRFYAREGIQAFAPPEKETQSIVLGLISELMTGSCENGAQRLDRAVRESFGPSHQGPMTACLACTELPLAFPEKKHLVTFEHNGVLYLNTTIIHARAAFEFAVGG